MVSSSPYRELDIREGASLNEIKAAYRKVAKSCHPDAVSGKADPDRFSRASEAYRSLLREVMGALKGGPSKGPAALTGKACAAPYRFIGRKALGLDVFYDLLLLRPAPGSTVEVRLPWTRRDACPRCLGKGETVRRSGGGFVYRPSPCPRCQGKGYVEEERLSRVSLTPEMIARGRVRVNGAGGYLPKEGRRGDLVLNILVAETMPRDN
ncbi:MAG: DnaJ domain-containing protein [Deltaproteobacteria bacterium]|jgi:DnaJ-class molecular chaperone|nr:DnaJ domain-containing protein [Deltaproteobacteria bacterium]